MTIFEEVKELVSVPTVARYYGIDVRRGNMCLCPFHNERTPSMKLYEKNYYCFGCKAHGDVINLVQEIFRMSAIRAVKRINNDFSLGLDIDKPPEREDIERINRQRQELEEYQQWEKHSYKVLNDYLWLMRDYAEKYALHNPDDIPDKRFIYSQNHISYAEYLANEFLLADKETKLSMKGEIEQIEQEMLRIK